jgi:hypothetical protein
MIKITPLQKWQIIQIGNFCIKLQEIDSIQEHLIPYVMEHLVAGSFQFYKKNCIGDKFANILIRSKND